MLVLSRMRDESIVLDFSGITTEDLAALMVEPIQITCVDIRGDKTRSGITAPKSVAVHRFEVYEAIKRENRAAAQVKPEEGADAPAVQP